MSYRARMAEAALRTGSAAFQFARREVGAVAALLALAMLLNLFLGVADEVAEGDSQALDLQVLQALRDAAPDDPVGPHWLEIAAADITSLGSIAVLTAITLLVAGLFASLRRFREALVLVVAAGGGVAISQGLKAVFGRERPELVYRAVEAANPSFPSGHAMLSAVVFLTLGALTARFAQKRRVKVYVMAIALVLTLLVGLSRVYLGVHWLTDVLAGWSAGAAWALVCWLLEWAWERWAGRRTTDQAGSS